MPRGVPKNPRPKKPPKEPRAWRDPKTGDLWIDVAYRRDFTTALKDSIPYTDRGFDDGLKLWNVNRRYALSAEDLLEAYYPEVMIDYRGYWAGYDQVDDVPEEPPPF